MASKLETWLPLVKHILWTTFAFLFGYAWAADKMNLMGLTFNWHCLYTGLAAMGLLYMPSPLAPTKTIGDALKELK